MMPANRLIAVQDSTVTWHIATALEIAQASVDSGTNTTLVSVYSPLVDRHFSMRERAAGRWYRARDVRPDTVLRELAAGIGVSIVDLADDQSEFIEPARAMLGQLPDDLLAFPDCPLFFGLLGNALLSWLVTDTRKESVEYLKWEKEELIAPLSHFLSVKSAFVDLLKDDPSATEVCAYNTRLPCSLAPYVAALEAGCGPSPTVWEMLEETSAERFYFAEPSHLHDRVFMQAVALKRYSKVSQDVSRPVVETWLNNRQVNPSSNQFLVTDADPALKQDTVASDGLAQQRYVTFYTSSMDEFVGVAGDWTNGDWTDQFDAFLAAIEKLTELNYRSVIRVHPNLINKSWREYRGVISRCAAIADTIILPTDAVDSYELARNSDAIFVWGSTIGLEAVAMGVPTYCMGAAFYDELADVRKLRSRDDVNSLNDVSYPVDRQSAWPSVFREARGSNVAFTGVGYAAFSALRGFDEQQSALEARTQIFRLLALPRALARGPAAAVEVSTALLGRTRSHRLVSSVTRYWLARSTSRRRRNSGGHADDGSLGLNVADDNRTRTYP